MKLIGEQAGLFELSPVASLAIVLGIFTIGIVASLIGDVAHEDDDPGADQEAGDGDGNGHADSSSPAATDGSDSGSEPGSDGATGSATL